MEDIFTILCHYDLNVETLEYIFKSLGRNFDDPMKEWGSSIASTHKDPAISLLEKLVFQDKTTILMNMVQYSSNGDVYPAFTDCLKTFIANEEVQNCYDLAMLIGKQNQEYDEEGMPTKHVSESVSLWVRWLEGDRSVEDSLMYTLARRFWRITTSETRNFLKGVALYAHAQLFYNVGWNPETKEMDLPSAKQDRRAYYLVGKNIPLKLKNEVEIPPSEQQAGSLEFNCIPRVPLSVCESTGHAHEETRVLWPLNDLRIASFGDEGVAVEGELGGEKVMYFLQYPEEYEDGAMMVWDMMIH